MARDPEVVIKRIIVAVWAVVVVVASGFGATACFVGFFVHDAPPYVLLGGIACLVGAIGGLYLWSVAMRPGAIRR